MLTKTLPREDVDEKQAFNEALIKGLDTSISHSLLQYLSIKINSNLHEFALYVPSFLRLQGHDVMGKRTMTAANKQRQQIYQGKPSLSHKSDMNVVRSRFLSSPSTATRNTSGTTVFGMGQVASQSSPTYSDALSSLI